MSPQRIRQIIGGLVGLAGAAAFLTGNLQEHQAVGIIFFGIAIAIWPNMGGKPKK